MKKKKIWLVNHYAVPNSLPGITRHFELFSEILNNHELAVTFWLSSFNYSLRRFITKKEKARISNENSQIELNWCWAFPHKRNDWRRVLNMLSFSFLFFIRALFSKKPDVVFASSPQIFCVFAAYLIAKLFKIRFILEVRDLWPESLAVMKGNSGGLIMRILYNIERKLYRGADHIVVLTEHQRIYIVEKGITEHKISFIPNGIIVRDFVRPDQIKLENKRKTLGLDRDAFVAIYTGAHGTANSLDQLLYAGKYLEPNEFIILIGDGPEKPRLQALKETENIQQVLFFDAVPKTDILAYTAIADCGIISLKNNEIFRGARPNKLFDYMALGIPILSTIGGEVADIIEKHDVGMVVQSEDYELIANSLREIKNYSDEQKRRIVENGWRFILSEGSRSVAAEKLITILIGGSSN